MTFVPVVVNPPTPSSRANELGKRLTETIDGFRQENPGVSSVEIRQALSLATRGTGSDRSAVAAAIAVAFLVLGLAVFFYFGRGLDFAEMPLIPVLAIAIVVIGIVKVLKNR